MRSLFVVSSGIPILSILYPDCVVAHVLVGCLLVEVKHASLSFCSGIGCSNTSWLVQHIHLPVLTSKLRCFLRIPISGISLTICVKFQLLCKLLLCHIKSLVMHTSLCSSGSEISWKMILDVDNLGHILCPIGHSLCSI